MTVGATEELRIHCLLKLLLGHLTFVLATLTMRRVRPSQLLHDILKFRNIDLRDIVSIFLGVVLLKDKDTVSSCDW